jgi:hypothetical protein
MRLSGRLFHAYQPKTYDGGTVAVIGSGMAAVTEWVNVLRGGGSVVALRRSPELRHQPLSAPRCTFAGPWLDRYHAMGAEERQEYLADLSHGSFLPGAAWRAILQEGERSGRLQHRVGEVMTMDPEGDGVRLVVGSGAAEHREELRVDAVIAATGFRAGWQEHEVLRGLVSEYGLETVERHLLLADDCCVPGISRPESVLAVSGPLAAWAYPAGDSFAGMKYAARRFAGHVAGRRSRRLAAWCSMVRGGWPYSRAGSRETVCASR